MFGDAFYQIILYVFDSKQGICIVFTTTCYEFVFFPNL